MACKLGLDIGGTFTDVVVMDERTGESFVSKTPTTPKDLTTCVMNGTREILEDGKIRPEDIRVFLHGTTVTENAIITRKTAKVGILMTQGFRDLLEFARQDRNWADSVYNWVAEKPAPLVPRNFIAEVPERISYKGEILEDLNINVAREALKKLKDMHIEALAVCFLHSYVNPKHEKIIREIVKEDLPGIPVSLSSEILPEIREFERLSMTVINAAVSPIMDVYLRKLETELRKQGITSDVFIMQPNGGTTTAEMARKMPVYTIQSGPAAGTIAAAYIGSLAGYKNLISFDMGGTTAKASMIVEGAPRLTTSFQLGIYPIKTPVIDLVEVGSGGGSIASVDKWGRLTVGPESAGADPGPVCYGKGGTEPTICDANVVLGRLNPKYILGGRMKILSDKARIAIKEKIADKLDMTVEEAARGIVDIADINMKGAIKLVSIERGYDPRDFALFAFGGAGPLHGGTLTLELSVPKMIVPPFPGAISSFGLLASDLQHDFVQTYMSRVEEANLEDVNKIYMRTEEEARRILRKEGVPETDIRLLRSADMRYVGQGYETNTPIPGGIISNTRDIENTFHEVYKKRYGYDAREVPVEIVNLRLQAIGTTSKPKLKAHKSEGRSPEKALISNRKVFFKAHEDSIECPIYDRDRLKPGNVVAGPAIIEETTSTTLISAGQEAKIDRYTNIIVEHRGGST